MFPFPESPTPSRGARSAAAGTSPEDRGKIILMGVGLLFCIALMTGLYAYTRSGRGTAAPTPAPADPTLVDPTLVKPTELEIGVVPLFPEEQAEEIEKDLLDRFGKLGRILDGVPAPDGEPFDFLVDMATHDARILNLLPEGFDRNPDTARMVHDPGAHRGKLLAVSGELLSLERRPWDGKVPQVEEIRRGVLRDAKGRLFSFSWPVANHLEPDAVEAGKGWVGVRGLFYKMWPVPDPADPGKTAPSFHLVLQAPPVLSYPDLVVKDIDPAWMNKVHDSGVQEMMKYDDEPLYYLLNLLGHLGPEGFEGWLKAKQEAAPGAKIHPPEDFTGRYRELLANPDLLRFRPVRYTGFLLRPTQLEREIPPNPGNVGRMWVGYLVDVDFAPAVWVYSPRSFTEQGFKSEDRIRVDGIYMKRVAYQAAGKGPLKQAALIVAGKMVPAPTGKVFAQDLLLVVVALMVVVAGGLGFMLFRSRKEERLEAERRKSRLLKRQAAAAAAAPGAAPPPVPDGSPGTPAGPAT
jgi:hypothetical protein